MAPVLRLPTAADLPALSALCLRSKAYWGYDQAFLDACRAELTVAPSELTDSALIMAEDAGAPLGMAQVRLDGAEAEIWKLFVDPPAIGSGLGRILWDWCLNTAQAHNATHIRIEADPDAAPFYERMGAKQIGSVPSQSIQGRSLPLLRYYLTSSL